MSSNLVPPSELEAALLMRFAEAQRAATAVHAKRAEAAARRASGRRRGGIIRRSARPLSLAVMAAPIVLLMGVMFAFGVHDAGILELDANLVDDPADCGTLGTGDDVFCAGTDWAAFQNSSGDLVPANLPAGTIAATGVIQDFVIDDNGPDPSYHEPSNHDQQGIDPLAGGTWGCVSSPNPTDKDDIVNAYAIAVQPGGPDTDVYFYFGVERFDNSGTAFIGVWLFQENVACDDSLDKFTGEKKTGDILVLTDFTGGGTITSLKAYRFTAGATPADPGTFALITPAGADCDTTQPLDFLCANVNTSDVTTPWPFQDKDKPGPPNPDADNVMETAEFFEGGINLTDAFEDANLELPECFGSFLAETRSSDVLLGATLKDYALGDFDTCGSITAHKYHDLNANGVDDSDPALEDWTIFIDENGNEILDAGEQSAVTDANGDVSFAGLPFGLYDVCEVLQAGWFNSDPVGATVCEVVTVSADEDPYVDFGNFQQGTKSGTKFEDPNADGDLTDGVALPGWVINAYADDGDGVLSALESATVAATDTTDANGDYSFSLDPGVYIVCEVLPADWFQSAPNPGTADCSAGTGLAAAGYAVTITSGSSEEDNDFGNFQQGTKSGTKFEDPNADGDLTDGTALPGWVINAYADDGDGILSAGESAVVAATDTTDANGDYSFSLDPGVYIVCEVLPADWFQSAPNPGTADCSAGTGLAAAGYAVTITSGSSEEDNDFGNFQQGTKSGTKFEDPNADGDLTDGTALPGWVINAYADDGDGILSAGESAVVAATDTTDANGDYSFSLDPGVYIVCEVLPADWFQSAPNPGTADCSAGTGLAAAGYAVTITSGSSEEDNDFGNFQQGTKSGTKFEDPNADGDLTDGTALPGWVINAYADDGDGILSAGESAVVAATDTTDANGDYSFSLDPGVYIVCEVLPADWFQSAPNPGTADCSAGTGLAAAGYAVTITSGSSEEDNDFGNFQQGTKSGTKFEDPNADGDLTDGTALPGWVINAYADDGDGILSAGESAVVAATDTTDANGDYSFSLDPGVYIVCEVLPADWFQSAPNPGTADCSAGTGLAAAGYAVTITSGSSEEDNDFGNFQQGTKSGSKFNDTSMDGIWDGTEPGLAGWTINVYSDNDDSDTLSLGDTLEATAVTADGTGADPLGFYSFSLDPGEYVVCEVLQTDWVQSAPSGNTACDFDAIDATLADAGFAVTIASGSSEEDNDFGNFQPPSEGCTPGFWQGGFGKQLWDEDNDDDWGDAGGDGVNPFKTTDTFTSFFASSGNTTVDNMTMLQIVGSGGTNVWARKAARDLIAAYLNSSFGLDYPYDLQTILDDWDTAVAGGTAGFQAFHLKYAAANELGCTIGQTATVTTLAGRSLSQVTSAGLIAFPLYLLRRRRLAA